MKQTILVVDDEADIVRLVTTNLIAAGYSVLSSQDGQQAIKMARSEKPDLMILDLMLPEMSGFEVCRVLRSDPEVASMPIIMLTAKVDEIDHVVGLELGADDFITKPFSPRVLLLRVKAVLRRSAGKRGERQPKQEAKRNREVAKISGITLDRDRCEVRVGERTIEFSPTEFKLLAVLVEQPGKVHSREKLLNAVWGYEKEAETRTVDMHVLRLREKLGRAAKYLETVRGFGYRINEFESS